MSMLEKLGVTLKESDWVIRDLVVGDLVVVTPPTGTPHRLSGLAGIVVEAQGYPVKWCKVHLATADCVDYLVPREFLRRINRK